MIAFHPPRRVISLIGPTVPAPGLVQPPSAARDDGPRRDPPRRPDRCRPRAEPVVVRGEAEPDRGYESSFETAREAPKAEIGSPASKEDTTTMEAR